MVDGDGAEDEWSRGRVISRWLELLALRLALLLWWFEWPHCCCGGDDDCGVGSGWDGGSGGGAGVTFGTIVQRPTGFPILGQSYQ